MDAFLQNKEQDVPRGINRRIPIVLTRSLIERFWGGVPASNGDGCWNWSKSTRGGYGAIKGNGGRVLSAHRVSYTIHFGKPSDRLVVTHVCDNKQCCNPWHLIADTVRQNNLDAVNRGAYRQRGTQKTNAKLTEDRVRELRAMNAAGMGALRISRITGLGKSTIQRMLVGKSWKHVK